MHAPRSRWLVLSLALLGGRAEAAPAEQGNDRSRHVIPPGREAVARELLARVIAATPAGLDWRGPTIEFDRIKWWLQHDGEPRGMLLLVPRELATPDEATSHSFAIRVAWASGEQPSASALALMDEAVQAIQAGDHGQFYDVRFHLFDTDFGRPPPYAAPPPADPAEVHRRWALEFGGVALLGLLALAVTLRRRPAAQRGSIGRQHVEGVAGIDALQRVSSKDVAGDQA